MFNYTTARGIFSKVGASCLYVAANFTSFPYDCEMPDLAFKCRCQNLPFLGTVTNCINDHAPDPHDLSTAYKQLIEMCKAQGGKTWEVIDLVKISENATQYLVNYNELPTPRFKASLVWKAKKIHDVQIKNKKALDYHNAYQYDNEFNVDLLNLPDSGPVVYDPYSEINNIPSSASKQKLNPDNGMIQDGKVIGVEKLPNYHNLDEIEQIGVNNILQTPRYLLYNPVNVPTGLYNISFNSVSNLMDQRALATRYGYYVYAYWGAVLLIATISNIAQWTSPYHNNRIGKTKFAMWCKSKIICPQIVKPKSIMNLKSNSGTTNVLLEMIDGPLGMFNGTERVKSQNEQLRILSTELLEETNYDQLIQLGKKLKKLKKLSLNQNSKGSRFYRNCKTNFLHSIYTMPVRMHALVIIGYLILNIVLCCVNYKVVYPNTVFTCRRGQSLVAIADRTGILGTVQLPILYLFSSRNNIFSKVTGLSYRSFQMFHKWTSRVVFILLVLHCAFYLTFVDVRGDYIQRWGLLKWRCANAAFGAITVTFLTSFFRRSIYEWFKFSHRILLLIFSIGTWYHCLTLGWIEYLGIAYTIWGLEYLIRWCKLISSGGILKGQFKIIFDTKTKDVHSIKIVVNHSGWWKPFPGCYCWMTILKYDMFWQSHPFTVISATSANNYNQLVFIIRVKNGLTKRLAKYISKFPNGECKLNLLIEGPYGNNVPFKQYDHSVLVAGGVGMAIIYSIAMDLAQIYRAQGLRGKRHIEDTTKCISLIWLIPNFESLVVFKSELEYLENFKDIIQVQIFITRELQDEILQEIIIKKKLVNPLVSLSKTYDRKGFKGFASELIKNANILNVITNTGMGRTASTEDTNLSGFNSSFLMSTGNVNNYSKHSSNTVNKSSKEIVNLVNEIERKRGKKCGENEERFVNIDKEEPDLENGKADIIREQRSEEIEFLRWLIAHNGEQISISFEDKPLLEDELTELLVGINNGSSRSTALIACGPTSLNADVRLSVVKCLERDVTVEYYEEELLW